MKCPKCGQPLARLEPYFNTQEISLADKNYKDVDFTCRNDHRFFVRIKPEDLIEVD